MSCSCVPVSPEAGFPSPCIPRPAPGATELRRSLVVATICYLAPRTDEEFAGFFDAMVRPRLEQASAILLAALVTERSPNTFPRLPVREGETVFVWFSAFPDLVAYETHLAELSRSEAWAKEVVPEMERRTWRQNEVSRLTPTTDRCCHEALRRRWQGPSVLPPFPQGEGEAPSLSQARFAAAPNAASTAGARASKTGPRMNTLSGLGGPLPELKIP